MYIYNIYIYRERERERGGRERFPNGKKPVGSIFNLSF